MTATSYLPILALFPLALCTLWLLDKKFPLALSNRPRISSLDGLRGYLAFAVFLHHSCIWYFYLQTGEWTLPPSPFYAQLGKMAVAVFFMITAYLFTDKLLATPPSRMDWVRLYTSRILRIAPLWLLVKILVVALTLWSKQQDLLHLPPAHLQRPSSTGLMTAGVTWTLYYEWIFYLLLPCMALLLGKRPAVVWLALSVLLVTAIGWDRVWTQYSWYFVLGMLASTVAKRSVVQRFATSFGGSVVVVAALALSYAGYARGYFLAPLLLLGLAFCLIVAGAHLFHLLDRRLSRVFGEVTFGIYLLHGTILYLCFRWGMGWELATQLTPLQHWMTVAALTPALVVAAYASFVWIEQPAMQATSATALRLRALLQRVPGQTARN